MKFNIYSIPCFIVIACTALAKKASFSIPSRTQYTAPKVTVVMVIDQFAHWQLQKIKPYLTGGLKFMLEQGLVYENAYYPHAMPETAVGHTSLSTGVLPKDHGIVGNIWFEYGKLANSDDDTSGKSSIFLSDGTSVKKDTIGKSSVHMMVDCLSDQYMLGRNSQKKHAAVTLSLKSRASIGMAGKLGKAVWFDDKQGIFTSSKAYFNELPAWVITFNNATNIPQQETVFWKPFYPLTHNAYNVVPESMVMIGDYGIKPSSEGLINKNVPIFSPDVGKVNRDYELFTKTPAGACLLIECAQACLDEYIDHQAVDGLLLWVSCSSPDKVGHPFGTWSLESLDILYHVDHQLKFLIDYAIKKVGASNVLFALTADHGIVPILEQVNQAGYKPARRINADALMDRLNQVFSKKYTIPPLFIDYYGNSFFFNHEVLDKQDHKVARTIIKEAKKLLLQEQGIKHVWTFEELQKLPFQLDKDLEALFKNQLFKGRSGDLICQTHPYVLITCHKYGTSHASPYEYDTHVPLMLYQKGRYEHKQVNEKVWMQQVAGSLAHILNIPRPSASCSFTLLPGIG
jgi:predicted AlkP superfamily pyrophosphatase or phosphodiesterase